MDFKTFQKSIDQIKKYRETHEGWPDSRDPEFSLQLMDSGVVSQDIEKSLVALISWRLMKDSRYQGISAMVHLIRNRQVKGMTRSHLTEECFQSEDIYPDEDYDFLKILENLDSILQGKTVDITDGSTQFGRGTPESEGMVTKIGDWSFWK